MRAEKKICRPLGRISITSLTQHARGLRQCRNHHPVPCGYDLVVERWRNPFETLLVKEGLDASGRGEQFALCHVHLLGGVFQSVKPIWNTHMFPVALLSDVIERAK